MKTECSGTYGADCTPCTVYGYSRDGVTWYAVENSENVNCTSEILDDGVNVEYLSDINCFTSSEPITSADMLKQHADEMHDYFNESGW
jgi:hypothetical protein